MSKRKRAKRAKRIERAIRLTYDSLQSHMQYTHGKHHDPRKHHIKCIQEYAEVITILSTLY